MHERRKFDRTNVQKDAGIVTVHGRLFIGCTLRNLSTDGAGIVVKNATDIPDEFELSFGAAGALYQCRVVWRDENRIGLLFT
jgi:hypothetical protein